MRAYSLLFLTGLLGFAVMAGFAAAFDYFAGDLWISHRLQEIDNGTFKEALDVAEDLSDTPAVIIVWLVAAIAAFAAGQRWPAAVVLLSILSRLLNVLLKEIINRPRPSPELVQVTGVSGDFAFPSGHTLGAVVLYGLIAYFSTKLIRRGLIRLPIILACLYVIAFTAMERIYSGQHWFSDVYGAFLFGGLCLAILIWCEHRLSRR